MATLSPKLRHYLEIKSKHEDCIVLYQMGDFFEILFEDAILASEILGITLSSTGTDAKIPIPMCTFPVVAANRYIALLVKARKFIAVCETKKNGETGFPEPAKIVRVITPEPTYSTVESSNSDSQQEYIDHMKEVNTTILDVGFILKELTRLSRKQFSSLDKCLISKFLVKITRNCAVRH